MLPSPAAGVKRPAAGGEEPSLSPSRPVPGTAAPAPRVGGLLSPGAPRAQHALGIVLTTASAVAYSTAGFFTRLIHLDVWTVLLWRGLYAGAFIAAYVVWQHRRRVLARAFALGIPGLAAAGLSALATVLFINALRRTSVADVTVIFATAPFATAALGWLWTGEREDWTTLGASAAALAGVVVMVGAAARERHLAGDLLAFGMTLCMAVMMTLIRRHRETPMLPAASLSAFLSAAAAAPLAHPWGVPPLDMLYLVLFGCTQFGLGLLLLTLGTRLITATESALMSVLETPLAVIWVWLPFAEVPAVPTLVGGAIVMAAVSGHIVLSSRR